MKRKLPAAVFGLLVLALVATGGPWALVGAGNWLYRIGNFKQAEVAWTAARWSSWYERDVAWFDVGNGLYKLGQLQPAAQAYGQASGLAGPDHVCMIDYNWAVALSDWGDQLSPTSAQDALLQYGNAVRALSVAACNASPAYHAQYDQLRQQILQKIALLSQPPNSGKTAADSGAAQQILDDRGQEVQQQRMVQQTQQSGSNPVYTNGISGSFAW